jgi:hypothetical protein
MMIEIKLDLEPVFTSIIMDDHDMAEELVKEYDQAPLEVIYKASKHLSDLCWQEIQRRRRGD